MPCLLNGNRWLDSHWNLFFQPGGNQLCRNLSAADHAAEVERKEREERERERQLQPVYGRPEYAMLSQQALTGGGYLARRGS